MADFKDCTEVTPFCPVEATTYGYYPVLGPNAALLAVFGIICIAQIVFALVTRIYSYSLAIAAGALLESLGYVGRMLMRGNPWGKSGLQLNIICLILGPSFVAAGIYLTLKHVVRLNGAEHSRLKPHMYTWVFVGCDIGSIVLQAIGGGVAAAADGGSMLKVGNTIIIVGIAFQVVTMSLCGILAADYVVRRHWSGRRARTMGAPEKKAGAANANVFQAAVAFAYLTILIRCIYRLPELAGGWGNPRMRNEMQFLVLDGLMVALASAALTIFHPGYLFPQMKTGYPTNEFEMSTSRSSSR